MVSAIDARRWLRVGVLPVFLLIGACGLPGVGPTGSLPAVPADAEQIDTFDGEWLSEQFGYAVRITDHVGVATLSNSTAYGIGDRMLVILSVDGNKFDASQRFADGSVQRVIGRLTDPFTITMVGAGLTWTLQRISPLDLAPAVDAGEDRVVLLSQGLAPLIGTAEDDRIPVEELETTWRLREGPDSAEIEDDGALETAFTFSEAGVYTFDLAVSDGEKSSTDSVTITVNTAPTAVAGEDRAVAAGALVNLDGSASAEPDAGDSLTFLWGQVGGPDVTINNSARDRASFVAPDPPAEVRVELTVTDSFGASATDEVVITVNNPPVADAGEALRVAPGQTVQLDGLGTIDPDEGATLHYSWTQTGGAEVELVDGDSAEPSFTAPEEEGTLIFRMSVVDEFDAEDTDSVNVTVVTENRPPIAAAGSDRNVVVGLVVTLDASGSSDPDGDALSFAWDQTDGPAVEVEDVGAGRATFTVPEGAETFRFSVIVQDGLGGLDSAAVTLTVVDEPQVRIVTSMGEVVVEVLLDEAPITSLNFLRYVDAGFYNGTIFHRVVPEFVVQGGGFLPGMIAQAGLRDPIINEFSPDRSNIRGTVAMAKQGDDPDSATSQFFFNLADNSENLDNQNGGFTVFARLVEGMDVVDAMAEAALDGETPVDDIILSASWIE